MPDASTTIKLTAGVVNEDPATLETTWEHLSQCGTLQHILLDTEGSDEPIPVQLSVEQASLVIEYGKTSTETEPHPEIDDLSKFHPSAKDQEWIKSVDKAPNHSTVIGLVNAANYLDHKRLFYLGCHRLADVMKGKGVDEVIKEFGIVKDPNYKLELSK